MKPLKDWMILEKIDTGGRIKVPDGVKVDPSATPFKVKAIGPGFWIQGPKFIACGSTDCPVKVGSIVILDAPMIANFSIGPNKYVAAQAQNVAFILDAKDIEIAKKIIV